MMAKQSTQHAYIKAYEIIRDKILSGEIKGGTKLIEERLADDIGVSRTPIRESIRRLEQEGLISKKKVIQPTESDLRHSFQVRILLEGEAARSAASYMSENHLEVLSQCVKIGKSGSKEEVMEANKRFHDVIMQASRNPVMIDIIDRMQSIIYLFRKTVVYHQRPLLIEEHEKIYDAIRRHEPDEAEQLMKMHLQADLDFSLHVF